MKAIQQDFKSLVDDAHSGKLRLPEFQRDWKWTRPKVLKLYDSVRKDYPIGGFLTLESSDKLNLSPRMFEGIDEGQTKLESYVLDGQQRITAGLMLYYGTGKSHYFLDLSALWNMATEKNLDYDDLDRLMEFATDLDDDDKYIKGRRASSNPENLLVTSDLLWTPFLTDDFKFSIAKERYLEKHPNDAARSKFMERLVGQFFKIGDKPTVPVTVLDADMPVEAITRVFQTLNTSGQLLTPVEIVVAVLYAQGIRLRQELEELQILTDYYRNMETTGEIFLQTIALLDGKNPKKTTLPKTISRYNFRRLHNDAITNLERAGVFLSNRLGMGLDATNRLVPYDAMLVPLGIALAEIEQKYPQPSADKAQWHENLERWFVGSILEQRYTESQPATQLRDKEQLLDWIAGDASEPVWMADVRIRSLERVTPTSAIGKLIACLISHRRPKDPLNKEDVGGTGTSVVSAQSHHIFPKGFCELHIPGWSGSDTHNLALNVMPLTKETNKTWSKDDPANQISSVRNRWEDETSQLYDPFFIDERCIEIMEKPHKTKDDFNLFVKERGRLIQEHIARRWGFVQDAQQVEDEEEI
jgi:hypothetical protein